MQENPGCAVFMIAGLDFRLARVDHEESLEEEKMVQFHTQFWLPALSQSLTKQ